ncbi:hypothetical protein [Azotobacter beijerinckii]|uniref:Uncharacterized protein n=1 Tax=Azotobacter beijerinckii TaxID=170623 RepID=A0A1I4AG81_9GAMM|nr:hypothetical protein [Azotobacter beijerinckii]SFA94321.1 hypothetical protein SAMN04244571_00872 [Azotobacter beijerinckii]SFK55462.1 hypothetical protein SAMN04244574_01025 [Azotobacter beijerinckii]
MDNNKDPGGNLALWLPGSAVIISLVVSTFALTREPFLEARPTGAQFQVDQPIEARLWQDPFDALERHRKKYKDNNTDNSFKCDTDFFSKKKSNDWPSTTVAESAPRYSKSIRVSLAIDTQNTSATPEVSSEKTTQSPEQLSFIVALVPGGPYADEVEFRRRVRYAILAGFKNARMVPKNEQHIGCLIFEKKSSDKSEQPIETPYEIFIANPLDPPKSLDGSNKEPQPTQATLLWVKEENLTEKPLRKLEELRRDLWQKLFKQGIFNEPLSNLTLKVIGPSNSKVLRLMYQEDALPKEKNNSFSNIEIYSPLATTSKKMLVRNEKPSPSETSSLSKQQEKFANKESIKLLRTISDDDTLARLLLEELKRRWVDPTQGLSCSRQAPAMVESNCDTTGWKRVNRIALVSEWDSFYSRALAETFKENIVERAVNGSLVKANIDDWILQFSYLRGLDGRLPEESASNKKTSDSKENDQRNSSPLDIGSLEKADGNSQLDYLRRLADHIAERDENYRRNGESGIGAIGVLGTDAYDKLLVLQALKSRMPNKVFFSTDLDARMLQRGQAETVRNLVLAAPYGLVLTHELQQDVPPFRESSQSAVFVAVLTALAPQRFEDKRARFDYSASGLLSPGIYEVGTHGFIPLKSSHANVCQASARVRWRAAGDNGNTTPDIMSLSCLQDEPPPPYPELSKAARDTLSRYLSIWWAKPLSFVLLGLAILLGWWSTAKDHPPANNSALPSWVRNLPLALYVIAALSALCAVWLWRVEFMWATFLPILLGIICSRLINNPRNDAPASADGGLFDSPAYYIVVPLMLFLLALLWAYQQRRSLTEDGLGEPMFLFEGISAWPTLGLRLLAVLISISALAWGWRNLRINKAEIETSYYLWSAAPPTLWKHLPRFVQHDKSFRNWLITLGDGLFQILFPLSSTSIAKTKATEFPNRFGNHNKHLVIYFEKLWEEHCVCGTFGARMLRAILATWVFVVATSALYVLWPIEGIPMPGEWESQIWKQQVLKTSWMVPTFTFQLLVFWVADANLLLVRFIYQLSNHHALWPPKLQKEHKEIFGIDKHPCIDDWVDMMLIAKRTAAVNRLIYAPTIVLLILIVSRSSIFDNWPTPPSMIISYLLTALVLFSSALSLRRAAEKARGTALQRIDQYLLETSATKEGYDKFRLIRERIAALNTGAFSRYTEEPLVRALLLSLAGIGGSAIVEVLNYSKF